MRKFITSYRTRKPKSMTNSSTDDAEENHSLIKREDYALKTCGKKYHTNSEHFQIGGVWGRFTKIVIN